MVLWFELKCVEEGIVLQNRNVRVIFAIFVEEVSRLMWVLKVEMIEVS